MSPAPWSVMFDMDGLLLDTERVILDSFVETRRAFDLPDGREIFLQCIGLRPEQTSQAVMDALRADVPAAQFDSAWEGRITDRLRDGVPVKPAAPRLLDLLSQQGIAMGVATSTDTHRARAHLEKAGLLHHFREVVGGDLVTRNKPDPESYLTLAARMGVPATACVAFEDSAPGTRAAVASGARTIHVPDLVDHSETVADLVFAVAPDLLQGAVLAGLLPVSVLD